MIKISYIRAGHPLVYMDGTSSMYIFPTYREDNDGEVVEEYVEDYDIEYNDKLSLIDMLACIVERDSGDEKFAYKVAKYLARHMGVENKLRPHKLTPEETDEEYRKLEKKLKDSPDYKKFIEQVFNNKVQ